MRKIISLITLLWCTSVSANSTSSVDAQTLLERVAQHNHIVLLRHALAPGGGDPAQFDVNDCSTQRNLNQAGRTQALTIGSALRSHGINQAKVLSSQWCRCLETARLLRLGAVTELSALNSFFQARQNEEVQTQELRLWLQKQQPEQPLILVTHQVNITALTGVYPASGELVILKRIANGELEVVGRIDTLDDLTSVD